MCLIKMKKTLKEEEGKILQEVQKEKKTITFELWK